MDKTLGQVARDKWKSTSDRSLKHCWEPVAAAVVAEHESGKWRLMEECPQCDEEIIAGFRDAGGEWVQCIGNAAILSGLPYYTHWQYAPEGPEEEL